MLFALFSWAVGFFMITEFEELAANPILFFFGLDIFIMEW